MKKLVEIWKPIKGYEDLYEISNFGRVKSFNYMNQGKEKILKLHTLKYNYKQIMLQKNNIRKCFLVHRLVAEYFIPNPNNLPYVNHKDENPANNHVSNLEWCSQQYNVNYGTCIERRSKSQSKPVLQFDLNDNFIREYSSIKECAILNDFNQSHVASCCRGERKTHKNFIFKFK